MKKICLFIFILLLPAVLFAISAVQDSNYLTVVNKYKNPEITIETPPEIILPQTIQAPPLNLKIGASSHLYGEAVMLYGFPTVGGEWDFGINIDTVTISLYTRYLHFFRPLGSGSGKLAVAEEFTEIGLSFKVKLYELGRFNANIGINTGWYQQWLMFGSNAGTYNMINNGMMVRPEASIGWNLVGWWNVELGLFYQTAVYPSYDGYSGWGVFLKLV